MFLMRQKPDTRCDDVCQSHIKLNLLRFICDVL